jgi:hypothetical protein
MAKLKKFWAKLKNSLLILPNKDCSITANFSLSGENLLPAYKKNARKKGQFYEQLLGPTYLARARKIGDFSTHKQKNCVKTCPCRQEFVFVVGKIYLAAASFFRTLHPFMITVLLAASSWLRILPVSPARGMAKKVGTPWLVPMYKVL